MVDAQTGDQQWAFQAGRGIYSSPTVVDSTVFVGCEDNHLYAVDADTGQQQWTFETELTVNSSPTVVDGTVFVGSFDSKLYAVNTDTGDQQWAVTTGNSIFSSPTVVDGTLFVGSDDNNLYTIDADVDGSSEGSRVRLKTLGHHDVNLDHGGEEPEETVNAVWDGPSQAETDTPITVSLSVESQAPITTVELQPDNKYTYADIINVGKEIQAVGDNTILYAAPYPMSDTIEIELLTPQQEWAEPLSTTAKIGLETGDPVVSDPYTLEYGGEEPSLFNLTVDAPSEAVAGNEVTISVDAEAAESQISAFQIAPDEQPDHVNDFSDLSVTTTAETQIEEPGFVVYSTLQDEVTVEWTGTIPETAEAGETFTLAGDALNEAQDRQLFSQTVTVTDDPLEKYRNENGEIDDTGLLEAISDWRDDELEDTQLLQLISEWRDAGGNVENLPAGALPSMQ